MFRRLARTPYDREYNREYNQYNSGAYAREETEKNEGLLDASDMPKGTLFFPRTHFSGGRTVHHQEGMAGFAHEDQMSKLPIKKEVMRFENATNRTYLEDVFGSRPDNTWHMSYNVRGEPTGWEKTVETIKQERK